MTANESPASDSFNTNAVAKQAEAALNTLGDKVSDLTGQHETVNKVVTGLQENILGTPREQSNEDQNGSTTVAEDHLSNEQVEEFLRHQYRSYKA